MLGVKSARAWPMSSHSLDQQSKDELEYDSWKERGATDAPVRLKLTLGWGIAWISAYIVIPAIAWLIGYNN